MKIYVINLARDEARWRWCAEQAERLGLTLTRFEAFTPQTTPERFRSRFNARAPEVLLPNNIASFSSHLGVAEQVLNGEEESCLVLEDDIEFLCGADDMRALHQASLAFDILKLNYAAKAPTLAIERCGDYEIVRYLQVPRGAGSYFLTKKGAATLLQRAQDLAISTDNFIRAEAYYSLDIAGVMPTPVPQERFGGSSLDPTQSRKDRRKTKPYTYRTDERARGLIRALRAAQVLGPVTAARMFLGRLMMSLRGVKRDDGGAYVIRPR